MATHGGPNHRITFFAFSAIPNKPGFLRGEGEYLICPSVAEYSRGAVTVVKEEEKGFTPLLWGMERLSCHKCFVRGHDIQHLQSLKLGTTKAANPGKGDKEPPHTVPSEARYEELQRRGNSL